MVMKAPVHPGEILREEVLADLGLSVGEAASRLGISRVVHGHRNLLVGGQFISLLVVT